MSQGQTQSSASGSVVYRLTLARISFFVLAAVAFVAVIGLIDAMLTANYAVYEYLSGINTTVLTAVISMIALVGLSGLMSAETKSGADVQRNDGGLGLHLKLTEPRLSGRDVERVQAMLHVLQFPIHIDGEYGPKTEAAIRSFQSSLSLTADGVVEETTLAALDAQVTAFGRAQWVGQILAQNDAVPAGRTTNMAVATPIAQMAAGAD